MAEPDDSDRYRAPALDKGLDILELLAASDTGLTQAEIAKAIDRSPNEIYRMLDRLVRRAYVHRTDADRYEISLKLFELAHAAPPLRRLVSQAMPVLRRFARDAEQSCHLVIHDRGALVVVAQIDGPGYWNVSVRVGARLSLTDTGSGRIFLAFASDDERALMLEDSELSKKQRMALDAELAEIRRQGLERMVSRQTASVTNLSVPVFGPLGSVIAVFTCPYTERLDRPESPGIAAALALAQSAAAEISPRNVPA